MINRKVNVQNLKIRTRLAKDKEEILQGVGESAPVSVALQTPPFR